MAKDDGRVGTVTHFYSKIGVGIVELSASIKKGDRLRFGDEGKKASFEQPVVSMQLNYQEIESGKKGQEVGVEVAQKVKKR